MRRLALALGLAMAVTAHAGGGGDGPPGSSSGDTGAALPGMGLSAEAMLFTGSATARLPVELPAGQNPGAGNAALSDTFAWYLTRVADLNDNTITVTYTQGTGVTRPATINYTGHGTTAGPYTVNLQWQSASAYKVSYNAGFRREFSQQL